MDEWDDQAGFDPEDPEIEAWDLMGLDDPVVAWDDTDDLDAYGDVEEPVAEGITYGEGHRAMTWSAWDVGVVFGLGGWLLDHHAAQVGQQIRDALAEAGTDTSTTPTPRGAPYPPPPSGNLYRADASQQNIGAHLDQGRLYGELVTTNTHDRDLLIEAEGQTPTGGKVVVAISFVALSAGPRMWVVVEMHPDGFSAARLAPVFQCDAQARLLYFATDSAVEAVDAVAWACHREGVEVSALTVTRRRT